MSVHIVCFTTIHHGQRSPCTPQTTFPSRTSTSPPVAFRVPSVSGGQGSNWQSPRHLPLRIGTGLRRSSGLDLVAAPVVLSSIVSRFRRANTLHASRYIHCHSASRNHQPCFAAATPTILPNPYISLTGPPAVAPKAPTYTHSQLAVLGS
jgi:hypothetical protein